MADVTDEHREAAKGLVSRARLGPVLHPGTRLEVIPFPDRFRVAFRAENPHAAEGRASTLPQVIAYSPSQDDAEALVAMVLAEADAQVEEVKEIAANGEIPVGVESFGALHDHMDANMLGMGGDDALFKPHPLVGVGAPDLSEAWCGVLNAAHHAVDAMIKAGGLRDAPAPGRR